MGISWVYLGLILGISWAYLGHILGISRAYLGPSPSGYLTGPSGDLSGPSGNLNGPTGDSDDQDHGEDDGVDDYNLHANQSETRILVGQTPTSFHPVLPSEQLDHLVGSWNA